MKTRAAVAWEAGKPLEIEMLDLEGPKAGEVLIRNCYFACDPMNHAWVKGLEARFEAIPVGGTMRGGNTDATIVIANGRIQSPPMVSRAWAALVSHPRFFEPMAPKLREGSLLFVDSDLLELEGPLPDTPAEVVAVAATKLAREADAPKAASLVLLGAFARGTGIVGAEALDAALADSLPSYRQQFLESNQRALRAGWEAVPALAWPAWQSEAA